MVAHRGRSRDKRSRVRAARLGPPPVFGLYRFICLMKRAFVTATLLIAYIVRVAATVRPSP